MARLALFALWLVLLVAGPAFGVSQTWTCTAPSGFYGQSDSLSSACSAFASSQSLPIANCPETSSLSLYGEPQVSGAVTQCLGKASAPLICNGVTLSNAGEVKVLGNCTLSYTCPAGQSFVNGACTNTSSTDCSGTAGVSAPANTCAIVPPSGYKMQLGGCVYEMGGPGELWKITDGANAGKTMWCGGWIGNGSAAPSGSPLSVGVSKPSGSSGGTGSSSDPSRTGSSGGGTGGTGTGFNSSDAANLAKIASNTATLIAAVDNNTNLTGAALARLLDSIASGSGNGNGASGSWGGEDGAALSTAAASFGVSSSAADAAMAAASQAHEALISTAPTFGGDSSRWRISFNPFFGTFEPICSHTWTITLPGQWVQQWTLDLCPWAPYFRSFMFWALGIWTAWALWSTIYSHARRA